MKPTERLTGAVLIAVLLAATPLFLLTEDRLYLGLTLVLTGASAALGTIARRLRATDGLARALMLAPGALLVVLMFPQLPEIVAETSTFVADSYAPMDPHPGFRLLSALVLWLLFLITEALAVGLSRPGWTFPVLALPYLVPAIVLAEETSPVHLAVLTAGYVLVLATAVYNRFATEAAGMRRGVALAAVASLLAAWTLTGIASAVVPERSAAFLDPGQLNSAVQLGDPTVDLVRNLRTPSNRVIMSYRSSDGVGRYLRLAALPSLDAAGFHLVATDLMPGPLGVPQGLDDRPPTVDLDVTVLDFGSEWLPVPWVPMSYAAAGEWRFDPDTLAIVAIGSNRKLATRFLEYSVTGWDLQPGREEIAAAVAGDPADQGLTLGLPPELNPEVIALAAEVTADADSDGERVLELLSWLRSGEFAYSTEIVDGNTMETVSDFLLESRTGYCEQFAGSMAILARALGIPSRVVVGFLPGVETDQGFDVSVRDMHAWTEVYLEGLGWVAFDPTPSGAPGVAPVPTPSATPSASVTPSASASPRPSATPTPSRPARPSGGGLLPTLPAWTGGVLVALALAAAPSGVRQWRRHRRLRPGRSPEALAEDAWDELRDVVLDGGQAWPSGTPRQVAAALTSGLDPAAAAATARLAREVERARFAPGIDVGGDVGGWLAQATAGLGAARPAVTLLWRVLPRSVLRLRR